METIKKHYQKILIILGVVILTYFLILLFTKKPQMSELDKYKLNEINQNIEKLKNLQNTLNDSLFVYQEKIDQIDNKINNIKIETNQVNNYYTQKKEEIKNSTNKQIDSLLRGRYKNL